VTLATYLVHTRPGVSLWTMLVGGPSTGKTELINLTAGLPNVHWISTLTPAALLSGSKRKEWAPGTKGGLLNEIGECGFLAFKDFTSILDMEHKLRPTLLTALREIHDGRWDRPVGTDGARTISWQGKVGLIAACTSVIDDYHDVMNSAGPRFILYRLPQPDLFQQRKMATQARSNNRDAQYTERRQALIEAVAEFIKQLSAEIPPGIDWEDYGECVDSIALFSSRCRSQVTRVRSSHQIATVHDAEGCARIAGQLDKLQLGLCMIGVEPFQAFQLVRKTAFDCIPPLRYKVLKVLYHGPASGFDMPTIKTECKRDACNSSVEYAVEDLCCHDVVRRSGSRGNYHYTIGSEWLELWNRAPEGMVISPKDDRVVPIRKAL
jgi:hypothetical protein